MCDSKGEEGRMRYIAGLITGGGSIAWQHMVQFGRHEEPGITITFPLFQRANISKATKLINEAIKSNDIEWLRFVRQGHWLFDCENFKKQFPDYSNEAWLRGKVLLAVDLEERRETVGSGGWKHEEDRTSYQFIITPNIAKEQMPKKVFLSHKSADKDIVRRYKAALTSVGIDAWLDEDAMPAGTELERELLKGFEDSCAQEGRAFQHHNASYRR